MPKKIRAIVKRSDESIGHVAFISPTISNLQRIVGGYARMVDFGRMVILCDEDAKLKQKPTNCTLGFHVFAGDILAVGLKDGEFADCELDFSEWKEVVKIQNDRH